MEKAEEYYGRAILASPRDGVVLSLYGKSSWETQRDESKAKCYFDQALHQDITTTLTTTVAEEQEKQVVSWSCRRRAFSVVVVAAVVELSPWSCLVPSSSSSCLRDSSTGAKPRHMGGFI